MLLAVAAALVPMISGCGSDVADLPGNGVASTPPERQGNLDDIRAGVVLPEGYVPVTCPDALAEGARCWEVFMPPETALPELTAALQQAGISDVTTECTEHEPMGGIVLGCNAWGRSADVDVLLAAELQWRDRDDPERAENPFRDETLVLLDAGPAANEE